MRHRVSGRKLGRTTEHRLALLRNMSSALFDRERITTTLSKAKELRPFAERLVTLAKRETLHSRRQVLRHIHDRKVVAKLFDSISARYAERPGGYTRIVKLGPRRGDHAEMAIIELVDSEVLVAEPAPEEKGKRRKRRKAAAEAEPSAKKAAAKGEAAEAAAPAKRKKKTSKARSAKAGTKSKTAAAKGRAKAGSKKARKKTAKKKGGADKG